MKRLSLSRLSLEWKLPAAVCTLLLLVTAALFSASYLRVRQSLREAAGERLRSAGSQLAEMLRTQAAGIEHRVHLVASDPRVSRFLASPGAAARRGALLAILPPPSDSTTIAVELRDARGRRLLAQGELADSLSSFADSTLPAVPGGPDSAALGTFHALGARIVYPAVGMIAGGGRPRGYVVHWRRISNSARARELIARLIGFDATWLVGSPGSPWTNQGAIVPSPPPGELQPGVVRSYRREGQARLAVAIPAAGVPWYAVVEFPERSVFAPARRFLLQMSVAAALLLAIGIAVTWGMSRRLTGPLRQLAAAADALSADAHARRVALQRQDELGHLADAFNRMAVQVEAEVATRAAAAEQWRLLFENNPHPMWVFDQTTLRFLAVNESAIRQYGYSREEFLAMTTRDLGPLGEVPALPEGDGHRVQPAGTWRHRRRDGSELDVEITSHSLGFSGRRATLVLANDVTQRRALEAQLRQAQKMEAVGRLAGGVAHDFNNLLTAIMSYAELIRADLPEDARATADVGEIVRAAKQAHGLTRQLLAFSRQQVLKPVPLRPNIVIQDVERMLGRLIGEDIVLHSEFDADTGLVLADPGQIEQVLMNLAVNARDAMKGGGALTIRTGNETLGDADSRLHGIPAGGRYVVVTVSDTGTGMTPETQARIFEPFYTTKSEGTGLGLATVYGIVSQAGGHVTVYSEPGVGSTFRIYLPRLADDAAETAAGRREGPPPSGSETILLVEDDAAVRTVTAEALERQGYQVLSAHTPDEAIALASRRRGPLHLVVTDVVMPSMNGPTLVGRLRAARPDLKLLFMSGYPGDAMLHHGLVESGVPFIEKPFTLTTLASKVREALSA